MPEVVAGRSRTDVSYLEWSPVFAGALVAAALSFILFTFGAALGLSLVSPYPAQSYGQWALPLAAFFALIVPISAFLVGGYVAGRMRSALDNASSDEVEFRDGLHGLLVWALSIGIGALFAFMAAASATQAGAGLAAASNSSDRGGILSPVVNTLFRGQAVAQVSGDAARQEVDTPTDSTSTAQLPNADVRDDVARILAASVTAGGLNAADREYLAQTVSQRAGLPLVEAEKRVDEAYASAVRTVDAARKATIRAALVTATALMIGLAAAWYAAQRGGHHRDQKIPARLGFPRGPTTRPRPPMSPSSQAPSS